MCCSGHVEQSIDGGCSTGGWRIAGARPTTGNVRLGHIIIAYFSIDPLLTFFSC